MIERNMALLPLDNNNIATDAVATDMAITPRPLTPPPPSLKLKMVVIESSAATTKLLAKMQRAEYPHAIIEGRVQPPRQNVYRELVYAQAIHQVTPLPLSVAMEVTAHMLHTTAPVLVFPGPEKAIKGDRVLQRLICEDHWDRGTKMSHYFITTALGWIAQDVHSALWDMSRTRTRILLKGREPSAFFDGRLAPLAEMVYDAIPKVLDEWARVLYESPLMIEGHPDGAVAGWPPKDDSGIYPLCHRWRTAEIIVKLLLAISELFRAIGLGEGTLLRKYNEAVKGLRNGCALNISEMDYLSASWHDNKEEERVTLTTAAALEGLMLRIADTRYIPEYEEEKGVNGKRKRRYPPKGRGVAIRKKRRTVRRGR